jgi:hypothetical protein
VHGLAESAIVASGSAMPVVLICPLLLGLVGLQEEEEEEVRSLCLLLSVVTLTDDDEGGSDWMLQPNLALKCLHVLTDIDWNETGIPNLFGDEESPFNFGRSFGAFIIGCLKGEFSPATMVMYRLWEREKYLVAQQKCDEMYQAHLPGKSIAEARNLAVSQYVQEVIDLRANNGSELTPEHFREGVDLILRRAARWMSLVTAVGSIEILLIDQGVQALRDDTSIGHVIEEGTDQEFEELKQRLLEPSYGIKNDCKRLTGVPKMIRDLGNALPDTDIRRYLAEEVKTRIQDVFGESIPNLEDNPPGMRKINPGAPQRYINEIFGIILRSGRDESSVIPQPSSLTGEEHHPNSSQS